MKVIRMNVTKIRIYKKVLNNFFRNKSKKLSFILIILLHLFTISSCESDNNIAKKSNVYIKLLEVLDNDPYNYNACLGIVSEYEDTLLNNELDSSLAKLLMEKFTAEEIIYNIEGFNVKITGVLKKHLFVNRAEIRFVEHEESLTERKLWRLIGSNLYPVVEVIVKCRIIKEFSNEGYAHSFNWNEPPKISSLGVFKIKTEDILDHLFPGGFYESEVDTEREIKLRYKLWDNGEAEDSGQLISGRTKKIFTVLNLLKNIKNLDVELKLNEIPNEETSQGETVHTGPRGGKYVIRNGSKKYQ